GTLLSSQGTDASFVLTLSGFPPGFRSAVLRFQLYQIISAPCFSKVAVGFGFEFGDRWGSLPFGFHHVSAFPL
ncbi:hypothetical protein, partial [Streptomyces erythrochromogenes]